MKDIVVRLGQNPGEVVLVCWNCSAADRFTEKRTLRSKAALGVAALLTHKKLKCQVCGKYNQTGNAAKPVSPVKPSLVERMEAQTARMQARKDAKPKPPTFKEAVERAKQKRAQKLAKK